MEHIALVFSKNWEVFILAIGITLCTVYIKIFYDDFMGYPVDKAARQFEILNRFGKFSEAEKKAVNRKFTGRIIGKIIILILTLGTIVTLGFFRAETLANQDNANAAASEVVIQPEMAGLIGNSPQAEEVRGVYAMPPLTKTTFILITILFPVIGGVCLSLGLGVFHNRAEVGDSEKYFEARNQEYLKALGEFTEVAKNKEINENYLQRVSKNDFVNEFTNFFYHCYQHGYERGVVEPDKTLDIYERVQKLRDRLVSTRSFDAVQKSILIKNM